MSFRAVLMSDKRYSELEKMVRETYPKACILYIDEVINDTLRDAYIKRKEKIKTTRGNVTEKQLFHGTSEDAVYSICSDGFDPMFNKTSAFGKGTYFAKNAIYSFNYMKERTQDGISYMILADVLIGNVYHYGNNQPIDTGKHDNSVNNLHDPSIVVTPYADGAYPKYVIVFHKYAV